MSICKAEYLLSDKKSNYISMCSQNSKVELIIYQDGLFMDEDNPPEISYYLVISETNHKVWNASIGMNPNPYQVYKGNTCRGSSWNGSSDNVKMMSPVQYKVYNIYKMSSCKFVIRGERIDSVSKDSGLFFIDLKAKKLIGYVEDDFKTLSFPQEVSLEEFENLLKKRDLAEKLKQ